MRLNTFEMADNFRQERDDGSAYFLATADQKTSTNHQAYIYAEKSDWKLEQSWPSHWQHRAQRHPSIPTDQDKKP